MEPDIRLVLINALIAKIATKKDVSELRNEISELRREIFSNFKWTIGTILTI